MRIWSALWFVVVAAVGTFVVVNWQVLTAQTAVSLVVTQVTAPLGLIMLGAMATLALLGLAFIVWLETRALLQSGRAGRHASDDRAGLAELRTHIDEQLAELKAQTGASADHLFTRFDAMEQEVRNLAHRAGREDVP